MKVTVHGPTTTETMTGVTEVYVDGPYIVIRRPGVLVYHHNGQFRYTYTVENAEDDE